MPMFNKKMQLKIESANPNEVVFVVHFSPRNSKNAEYFCIDHYDLMVRLDYLVRENGLIKVFLFPPLEESNKHRSFFEVEAIYQTLDVDKKEDYWYLGTWDERYSKSRIESPAPHELLWESIPEELIDELF